jgi:ABC-type glutathione transport system ATPase component
MADVLLRVEDLKLQYASERGIVRAVDGVSFDVRRGEALVLLGESGCGKSSLAKALMRLTPRNLHHFSGRIELNGTDVMAFRKSASAARCAGSPCRWSCRRR